MAVHILASLIIISVIQVKDMVSPIHRRVSYILQQMKLGISTVVATITVVEYL